TPVLRYGEELGMGDDLSLPEREALRTPMQWSDERNGGFSTSSSVVRPVVSGGAFGYQSVNVAAAQRDRDSLLAWFQQMIHTMRTCPEIGSGTCTVLPVARGSVLAHRMDGADGSLLFLHNLGAKKVSVDVGAQPGYGRSPEEVFSDSSYPSVGPGLKRIALAGSGYRWLRLRS
ncbi:MAG: maltose alpha-D-glucosyltransferase / alpha-amylase, partial [Actinomycetota bacterium]|nr:maltose alpha-D-glucosyltransferase / alpha-amylase [Actinomycetota bacterium]